LFYDNQNITINVKTSTSKLQVTKNKD